jgi:hypothetical protein
MPYERQKYVFIVVRDENTSTEDKDDVKGSLYKESICEVDGFFGHQAIMIHEDFKAKAGQEIILKLATSSDSLYGISSYNGMRLMKFNISKILSKARLFHIVMYTNIVGFLIE